ncbi:helix-turn-helix domain-containing protein [Streptomyces reniochalinae]|nr:helix-turn-helix domain-containing protein [Streptomyces reniochalinae]
MNHDEVRLGLKRLAQEFRHKKHHRMSPKERAVLAGEVAPLYTAGATIRELSSATACSFGSIHRLLSTTEGVMMRGRGGTRRRDRR